MLANAASAATVAELSRCPCPPVVAGLTSGSSAVPTDDDRSAVCSNRRRNNSIDGCAYDNWVRRLLAGPAVVEVDERVVVVADDEMPATLEESDAVVGSNIEVALTQKPCKTSC